MSNRRKEERKIRDLEMGEGTGVSNLKLHKSIFTSFKKLEYRCILMMKIHFPQLKKESRVSPQIFHLNNLINNNYGNPVIGNDDEELSSESIDDGDDYLGKLHD